MYLFTFINIFWQIIRWSVITVASLLLNLQHKYLSHFNISWPAFFRGCLSNQRHWRRDTHLNYHFLLPSQTSHIFKVVLFYFCCHSSRVSRDANNAFAQTVQPAPRIYSRLPTRALQIIRINNFYFCARFGITSDPCTSVVTLQRVAATSEGGHHITGPALKLYSNPIVFYSLNSDDLELRPRATGVKEHRRQCVSFFTSSPIWK